MLYLFRDSNESLDWGKHGILCFRGAVSNSLFSEVVEYEGKQKEKVGSLK
jgi:hypothetical protein